MSRKISVGIDIGTYQIKVVVCEDIKEDGKTIPRVLGTGFSESKGLRHGYIINQNDAIRGVRAAVGQAERASKIKIKSAYISVGGIGLSSVVSKASLMISRADLEITDLDVKSVLALAESEIAPNAILNKKIVHSIPIAFKIDGQPVMGRPSGMKGARLEARVLFITCLEQHLNDLIDAVTKAGITVLDVMASPLAGSIVTLSKTQKIAGCALANIGSETVSVVVFENNIPISLEIFPIGGTDITNDIALGFRIPIDEAENLKTGSVSDAQYPKKKLDEIILARLSDIFDLIEAHLKKIGRSGLLPAGVILSGGSSGIETIEDLARVALKLPSRIASINLANNIRPNQIKDASWSVAYGLSVWGLNNGEDIPSGIKMPKNIIESTKRWLSQFLP